MRCIGFGFRTVLHQGDGFIAFFSRAVAPHHAKLPAYERELIGLVKAVRHWRPYLWGRPFLVRTDHYSLKFILDQRLTTIPQHTWVSKLFGYDFVVEYRPGTLNVVADALSRRDEEAMAVHALSAPSFDLFAELRAELAVHPTVVQLRDQVTDNTAPAGWEYSDGLLLFHGCIFLPDDLALWPKVLELAHAAGHEGSQKTLHRFRATFYSSQAHRRVREFVHGCTVCQRNKTEHLHPAGLLQPLPVPSNVWRDIAMDFVEGFPKDTHTRRIQWPEPSLTTLFAFTDRPAPSSATAILFSRAHSGQSFSVSLASSCSSARPSIHRRTANQK